MTEKETKGLPTTAEVIEHSEGLHDGLEAKLPRKVEKRPDNLQTGDKLVRRKDVEALIEDKIQAVYDKYEDGETPFDSYERAALRPFVQDLKKELLEEVKASK